MRKHKINQTKKKVNLKKNKNSKGKQKSPSMSNQNKGKCPKIRMSYQLGLCLTKIHFLHEPPKVENINLYIDIGVHAWPLICAICEHSPKTYVPLVGRLPHININLQHIFKKNCLMQFKDPTKVTRCPNENSNLNNKFNKD